MKSHNSKKMHKMSVGHLLCADLCRPPERHKNKKNLQQSITQNNNHVNNRLKCFLKLLLKCFLKLCLDND